MAYRSGLTLKKDQMVIFQALHVIWSLATG